LAVNVISLGTCEGGLAAPSWVVVARRDNGREVGRLFGGRGPGSGEYLLASVHSSLAVLPAEEFLRQWDLNGG